jgi:hypothetical protein
MKKTLAYFLYTMLIACIVCACNDHLDIVQDYEYSVETLPLPKTMTNGETVNLEFSILRAGNYSAEKYKFRYFESGGTGQLSFNGKVIPVNRFQDITSDNFVLTYECQCEEQQTLDFVFENSFGRRVDYTITFSGVSTANDNSAGQ